MEMVNLVMIVIIFNIIFTIIFIIFTIIFIIMIIISYHPPDIVSPGRWTGLQIIKGELGLVSIEIISAI